MRKRRKSEPSLYEVTLLHKDRYTVGSRATTRDRPALLIHELCIPRCRTFFYFLWLLDIFRFHSIHRFLIVFRGLNFFALFRLSLFLWDAIGGGNFSRGDGFRIAEDEVGDGEQAQEDDYGCPLRLLQAPI